LSGPFFVLDIPTKVYYTVQVNSKRTFIMFSFFKRNKNFIAMAAAPSMPPAPPKGGSAVKRHLELREEIRRPVESNKNYDSGPDIVDTIIAAEIISSAFDSSSSYDSGSSCDSGSSYDSGSCDFSSGGSDSSW